MSILKRKLLIAVIIAGTCLLKSRTSYTGCTLPLNVLRLAAPQCSCTVNSPTLNFGIYASTIILPVQISAGITVGCSSNAAGAVATYTIALGGGMYGTVAQRVMKNGQTNLNYNIYSDAYNTIWGDGTNGSQLVSASIATPTAGQNYYLISSANGQITPQNGLTPGVYTDSINITITF